MIENQGCLSSIQRLQEIVHEQACHLALVIGRIAHDRQHFLCYGGDHYFYQGPHFHCSMYQPPLQIVCTRIRTKVNKSLTENFTIKLGFKNCNWHHIIFLMLCSCVATGSKNKFHTNTQLTWYFLAHWSSQATQKLILV